MSTINRLDLINFYGFPFKVLVVLKEAFEHLEGVFREIFDGFNKSEGFSKSSLSTLLVEIEPMLAKFPSDKLKEVVRLGAESGEPSISVLCNMIESCAAYSGERHL